jgi:hypothetical protein
MSSCFVTLCPCCPGQRDVPSLYDDDLGDLEFENLLQGSTPNPQSNTPGHRTAHHHQSTSLWQRIAALFRRQQPIYLPDNLDDSTGSSSTFLPTSNPAYRPLAPPDAENANDFLEGDLMEEDVEVMSQEEIRHKIVQQASKVCVGVDGIG